MLGLFKNVRIVTVEERRNKQGGIYYIYNLLANGKLLNIYSTDSFTPDDKEHDVVIELRTYNNNVNIKLVEVR